MQNWMIYGANGYTGELIAREAVAQGLHPVLAGRRASAIATLAGELGLPHRVFAAEAPDLTELGLVLNCAGPFSATAAPLIRACLQARAHYLDITGEIDVFEHAQTLSDDARAAGVVVCPGVGFDVIPTDCVARALAEALPDATHLALGFETLSSMSPGTAKTSVEGLAAGGKIRRDGKIETEPMGWRTRLIDFGQGPRTAMAFPWGDVSTAYYTTGIKNIEVYVATPPALLWGARFGNLLTPLLSLTAVQTALKKRAGGISGPSAAVRAASPTYVWGEARNAATGAVRTARIRTANGYDVTVHGALAVVRTLLTRNDGDVGSLTPARLCGVELVTRLPGSGTLSIT
jgi:short subunit dehydrogenase-like uncharacterized protein